ncbi:MAG TPA: tetratricopeptide repeat protein [Thermoanaerobaculia bacterium]
MNALRRVTQRGTLLALLVAAGPGAKLSAATLAAGARAPGAESELGERLRAAEELLAAGRAVAAEAQFRQLVVAAPRLAEARHGLARALAALGRRGEALAALLELAAGSTGERAVGYAGEAAALAPESAAAQLALGRALMLAQRFDAALAPLARAAEISTAAAPHLYLGLALWESGRIEPARASLERAVTLAPGDPVARHQLGRLELWAGRAEHAVPLLREAAGRAPRAVDVQVDYALALERSGDLGEALSVYRRAAILAPESPAPRYGMGRVLRRLGDERSARTELERFARLQATQAEAQAKAGRERAGLDFGWNLLAAGRDAEAAAHFAGLALSTESLVGLAEARARLGDAAGAVAALERAVERDPQRHDLQLRLAEARQRAAVEEER